MKKIIKYIKVSFWTIYLILKAGDKYWDDGCKICKHFQLPKEDDSSYGYCEYFESDIYCNYDYITQDKYWIDALSPKPCKDCRACENYFINKIKYAFVGKWRKGGK